ncbi:MAG: class I SAM-dependent methyltransferase, partial [Methanoregulaceae archaeon]|nr:class I SAM-dependent methyltransferase [Methanoregulaceae archaeon]
MKEKGRTYPVSDTAALVMLWAREYYRANPLIAMYLEQLDLSSGRQLHERYNRICPWYSEVIVNRKYFIRNKVETLIGQSKGGITILNLAAGHSPLALELSPLLGETCRFVEIDISGMDRKQQLYSELIPERCNYVSGINADITDTAALTEAIGRVIEESRSMHLVVVIEGLSYYIGRSEMERVLGTLSHLAPSETIMFEHLKPCRLVSVERRFIPYGIFSHLVDYTGADRMTTYSEEDIRK